MSDGMDPEPKKGEVATEAEFEARREPMKRLRVGVTGLAVVVLLLALVFAAVSIVRRNVVEDNAMNSVEQAAANRSDRADEPLAQLGVAPSASDNAGATKLH